MSSESSLERIEKQLAKIADQQHEIVKRLARLEQSSGRRSSPSAEKTIRFLDQFRAGEALGEASLGAWIEACTTPCLKGGLRTVQMREGMHAVLLAQRIKELGGSCTFEMPDAATEAAMRGSADTGKTDAAKVLAFVERFPDIDEALRPIHEFADRLDADPETQSLLRTIAQDERSTLEFMAGACALLNG